MVFINGFLLGMSLILAIGAQNAFVLRTGLKGSHVFAVCLFCAISDALLIVAGIAGLGSLLAAIPAITHWLYIFAAIWIGGYGMLRLRDAWRGQSALKSGGEKSRENHAGIYPVLLAVAGLTWLNPHVYLDTVVLLGGISATLEAAQRPLFGAGAVCASFIFFFTIGYGARAMRHRLDKPHIWRRIDFIIALVMFWLAGGLLLAGFAAQ